MVRCSGPGCAGCRDPYKHVSVAPAWPTPNTRYLLGPPRRTCGPHLPSTLQFPPTVAHQVLLREDCCWHGRVMVVLVLDLKPSRCVSVVPQGTVFLHSHLQ